MRYDGAGVCGVFGVVSLPWVLSQILMLLGGGFIFVLETGCLCSVVERDLLGSMIDLARRNLEDKRYNSD